jgi:uncharacterized protein
VTTSSFYLIRGPSLDRLTSQTSGLPVFQLRSKEEISLSSFRGSLFENCIIADLYKQYFNSGRTPPLYFWRDLNGRIEIDCLIKQALKLIPIEIKSGEKNLDSYFDNITRWTSIVPTAAEDVYVVYNGKDTLQTKKGVLMSWYNAGALVQRVTKNI